MFPTRKEAKEWAVRVEYEIRHGDQIAAKMRLGELFDKYAREVSPNKKRGAMGNNPAGKAPARQHCKDHA